MRIDRTYCGGVRGGSLERRADAAGFDGQPVDRNGLGESADRIEAGIAVLASDPHARRAFAFANRAMSLQRLHTLAAERRRKDARLDLAGALTTRH